MSTEPWNHENTGTMKGQVMTQEDKKPEAADPVARIATALERIADALEQFDPGAFNVLADTLNDCLGETMVGNHFVRVIDLDRE